MTPSDNGFGGVMWRTLASYSLATGHGSVLLYIGEKGGEGSGASVLGCVPAGAKSAVLPLSLP
jgi:hypothetical protein